MEQGRLLLLTRLEQEHRVKILCFEIPPLLDRVRHFLALHDLVPVTFDDLEGARIVVGMLGVASRTVHRVAKKVQVIVHVTAGRVECVFDKWQGGFDVAVGMVDVFSGQSHCAEYRSQKNTSLFHSASRSLAKRVVGMSLLRSRSVLQVKHLARKQQLVHTQIRSTVCRSIALTAIIGTHGFLRTYRALW